MGTFPQVYSLDMATSAEALYYGTPQSMESFFSTINHCDKSTQVALYRLLTNHGLPLHAAWSHRYLDGMEALFLATCYAAWPGDQLHIPIPFSYLLQQPDLASMILGKRNALGNHYYRVPLIDLPASHDLTEITTLPIKTSASLLSEILQPHIHEYWIWKTDRAIGLLQFLDAQDAWDLCDWLNLTDDGAYSRTMVEQEKLARLGLMFSRYVMYNFDGASYESICSLSRRCNDDAELTSLAQIAEDAQHYQILAYRIDRFTKEGTARRTLWRTKLLLMALKLLEKFQIEALSRSFTDPRSPASLVRSFLLGHDVSHLPPFYLDRLVKAIDEAGVLPNLLLYPQVRAAHYYLQKLVLERPLPCTPLPQCIWRWRQILWKRVGDLRGMCNEKERKWRFRSLHDLLDWWSTYDELGTCLLMDPNVDIEIIDALGGLIVVRRLEELLPHIVRAHKYIPTERLSGGYLAGQRALARTIGTEVLYRGGLSVALPDQVKKALLSQNLSLAQRQAPESTLCRILHAVEFQENIPIKRLLQTNRVRKRRLSD